MCADHTSDGTGLIKNNENLIEVRRDVKSPSARGRELIKGHITSVILSQREMQGIACDPRELCTATPHPTGWESKEKQGGGRGWTRTHRHAAGHQSSAGVEGNLASKTLWRKERKPH